MQKMNSTMFRSQQLRSDIETLARSLCTDLVFYHTTLHFIKRYFNSPGDAVEEDELPAEGRTGDAATQRGRPAGEAQHHHRGAGRAGPVTCITLDVLHYTVAGWGDNAVARSSGEQGRPAEGGADQAQHADPAREAVGLPGGRGGGRGGGRSRAGERSAPVRAGSRGHKYIGQATTPQQPPA